jgi:hypothetical protein
VTYLKDSYRAIGQDGKHFNSSIIASPTNTSVPNNVLYALYYNSDHLPVSVKLTVDKVLDIQEHFSQSIKEISFRNPVSDVLRLIISSKDRTSVEISMLSVSGQVLKKIDQELFRGENDVKMDLAGIGKGVYLVRLMSEDGHVLVKKLVKN